MPEYAAAKCALWYVDARDEVRTQHALPNVIATGKRIVIPYCDGDDLQLFLLRDLAELTPGAFGILEPDEQMRKNADRTVAPIEVDFAVIPGVAFDEAGGRLGYGRGFYDRLLERVRCEALKVGLAFECQILGQIPMADHDCPMDALVTELRTIRCNRDPRVRASGEDC